MPAQTFFDLPDSKRQRVTEEAIVEFSERSFNDASLCAVVRRLGIAKGSIYQYFDDKLDLYRWLLTEEVPRRKRAFVAAAPPEDADFWTRLQSYVERGIAFLVEHPRLARLTASSVHPGAQDELQGLHTAVCNAAHEELQGLLSEGVKSGALPRSTNVAVATSLAASVIGPGLTDAILRELEAPMHRVLADDDLRRRIDARMRKALAHQAVAFLRGGLTRDA